MSESFDLAVVGAGAAGVMAAIQAGRGRPGFSIVALDGARTIGAKILVAGGGRCNVTHVRVGPEDFSGATRPAIAKVLRAFTVDDTVAFFRELGVELKVEETGKLFPTTDRARTVLDALLAAAAKAGVEVRTGHRVESIERLGGDSPSFRIGGARGSILARRVVLATGGMSLPKSGSDGFGYRLARTLGHTTTPRIFPALVSLVLDEGHPFRALSGIAVPARLEVRAGSGKRLFAMEGALLCTHFGISGPVVLDISRSLLATRFDDPEAALFATLLPATTREAAEGELLALGAQSVGGFLARRFPDRLAAAIAAMAGVPTERLGSYLSRDERKRLLDVLFALRLPVAGSRGFAEAEVTAGGVPLAEVDLATMESRSTPGLHLVGEILDVDGRIGGFNFQWAWATGAVAGRAISRNAFLSPAIPQRSVSRDRD